MNWVWILLAALIAVIAIGVTIKLILKKRLNAIDGLMGTHKSDDEDENIIGKL